MRIIKKISGNIEIWICKPVDERYCAYGKYDISGVLKIVGICLLMFISFMIGYSL